MSNFECIRTYKDLCKEIEACTIRRDELIAELRILNRRVYNAGPRTKLVATYKNMPGGGSPYIPFEQTWDVYKAVQEAIDDLNYILSLKHEAKRNMEKAMSEFDTLEYRVAYLRDVEKLPIAAIAMKLDYSYDWIAKISSRLRRLKKAS